MFRKILLFLALTTSLCFYAQNDASVFTEQEAKPKKSLIKKLWGDPAETSITAMPIGLHTDLERFKNRSTPNGLYPALYFAFNYKNVELALFKNSFGDLSAALNYKRRCNACYWRRV